MFRLSEPMAEILTGAWRDDHIPLVLGLLMLFFAETGLALALIELLAPFGRRPDLSATAIYPGVLALGLAIHHAYGMERAQDDQIVFFKQILRDFYAAGVLFALLLSAADALAP